MILRGFFQISKIKRHYCTKSIPNNKLYSNTIFLPHTKFPLRLENKKLVERDDYIYNIAEFDNLYSWQRSHLSEPEFVLHDGPPYANGQPHMGHAINKILKDTILRSQLLKGNKVHYIPGWDCHGLPIELKAIHNSNNMDPIELRTRARNFAQKTIEEQKKVFKSWGVIGDWKNAYQTFNIDYVKTELRSFFKLYDKKLIYRDVKPIYWSPSSRTALAEAELEYNEKHKSPSAYVRLEIKDIPNSDFLKDKRVYAIIWTTTPWSLPSNHAVCYNETLSYSIVKKSDSEDSDVYIIASQLLENLSNVLKCTWEVLKVVSGDILKGTTYFHPIYKERLFKFVHSSHATGNKGTGLVHSAGAHGHDDFLVALNNKLPIVDLVNEMGCYISKAGPKLEGKYVLSEGNKAVLDIINENLMHLGEITHSYPYDWRTNKPVIIKASKQWFIDTDAIKNRAVELLENVMVIPTERGEVYKKNLINEIQKRPYWCISRQRTWGVPIPVFYDKSTLEIIIDENMINHQCNLLEKYGTDFWWKLSNQELLPENLYSGSNILEKCQDILDIWFDSGISWAKVLEGTKVADMYLEGVDQFTGWFQSSLLLSVALRDKAPYKTVYVHGFAVDGNGIKMSKSTGNVIDPVDLTTGRKGKTYGVDTLRWWVTCHANQVSLANVSTNVLHTAAEEVQKIRSVLRFALGSLSDYKKSEEDYKNLLLIDRYMLHLLFKFHQQVNNHLNNYQYHKISYAVINLLSNPVSALYYTAIKDRLYCDNIESAARRAAQYVLLQIFEVVSQSVAPMVPHLVEEMYQHYIQKENKTYFTSSHSKPNRDWENADVETIMEIILNCKKDIHKDLGVTTIDAHIDIRFSQKVYKLLKDLVSVDEMENVLVDIFQVSKVTIAEDDLIEEYKLTISKNDKASCPRCRRIQSETADELCRRCYDVVKSLNNKTAVVN